MPRIPVKPGREVDILPDQTPFQTLSPPRAAFGLADFSGLAAGVGQLASGLQQAADDDARARAKELDVQYRQRIQELEYGSNGLYTKNGRNAVEAFPGTVEEARRIREEMISGVEDERIRLFFANSSGTFLTSRERTMAQHNINETDVAETQASLARVVEAGQGASLAFNDDDFIRDQEAVVRGEIIDEGERQGGDPVLIAHQLGEALDDFYRGIITNATTADSVRAKELFEEHKGKLNADTRQDLTKLITDSEELALVQAKTDAIMSLGKPRKDGMARARQEKDPALRKDLEKAVTRRYDDLEKARKEQVNVAERDFSRRLSAGEEFEQIMVSDPAMARVVDENPALETSLRAKAELAQDGKSHPAVSVEEKRNELLNMGEDEFLSVNLALFAPFLSSDEFDAFEKQQRTMRLELEGDATSRAQMNDIRSAVQRSADEDFPTRLVDMSNEERAQFNSIVFSVFKWARDRAAADLPVDPADIQDRAVAAWQETEASRTRGFFDQIFEPDFTLGEADAQARREAARARANGQVPAISVNNDPDQEFVEKTRSFLSANGLPTTDDYVSQVIAAKRNGDVERMRSLLNTRPAPVPLVPRRPLTDVSPPTAIEESAPPGRGELLRAAEQGLVEEVLERGQLVESAAVARRGGPGRPETVEEPPVPQPPEAPVEASEAQETPVAEVRAVSTDRLPPRMALTAEFEGISNTVYLDSEGIPTIGIGFNLERSDAAGKLSKAGSDIDAVLAGEAITDEQAQQLFEDDHSQAVEDARNLIPSFDQLTSEQQDAFVDMAFNLGRSRLSEFDRMLAAVDDGDFELAAQEAENSRWFTQVGRRGPAIVAMIRGD